MRSSCSAAPNGRKLRMAQESRNQQRSVLREGTVAGLLGAATVAAWFLVVDVARGSPLRVPSALGHILFHAAGIAGTEGRSAHVIAYTIFHVVAFVAVGVLTAALLRLSERQPSVLAGALILFVVFEAGFYGITSLLAQSQSLGVPSWYMVLVGNGIASLVMGTYLWRAHPRLRENMDAALRGAS